VICWKSLFELHNGGRGAGMVSIGSHRDGSYYHSPRAASTGIIASDVRGEDDTNNMEITVRMWMT
jgi:hypothetical protein